MDISRQEQRVLHVLAQGGAIEPSKDHKGRIEAVHCINRDGFYLAGILDLKLFSRLRRLKSIASRDGGPYRITHRGLELVRSQFDNRQ